MVNRVVQGDFGKVKVTEMRKVGGSRKVNDELRGRRNLTHQEIDLICKAIRVSSRYPDRDELLVLMAFHHGLRVSELLNVKWQHINLKTQQVAIKRLKNGIDSLHPMTAKRQMMLLRKAHKASGAALSGFVFINERGAPVTADGFRKMFTKFSWEALGVKWNPHALRHGCGTTLVEKGVDVRTLQVYLGHKNIQNTTQYLHESSKQFEKIEW